MRALTTAPGQRDSATIEDIDRPPGSGSVLVRTVAVGVCGTDIEILNGTYGWPPPGRKRLVLGHESLGRVVDAPAGSRFAGGDLVVGIVRRPDPVPCLNCAAGEWDMCRNGRYTECGIKERDGFCAEQFYIEPEFLVRLDPRLGILGVLLEPASILAKAWEHVERIGARARWQPRKVLVTGAGPVGLLAALMGVQRGLEVHVLDRATNGPKPQLVEHLGAHFHAGELNQSAHEADIIIECTGVGQLVFDVMQTSSAGSIVCLTGISSGDRSLDFNATGWNKRLVLENDVVFGSVNANRRHYEAAADSLARADAQWLGCLITRKVPFEQWSDALRKTNDDVKTVISFGEE